MSVLLAGFLLGISIIVAIGPQNAYIIKMGVKRSHIGAIVAVCWLSDVILINSGVAGVGILVEKFPIGLVIMKYLGATYLAYFAYTCFRDAFSHRQEALVVDHAEPSHRGDGPTGPADAPTSSTPSDPAGPVTAGTSVATAAASVPQVATAAPHSAAGWVQPVLTALALTWLNPLTYVDVLVMLGGIANQYGDDKWIFALGAVCASTVWFPALGFGAFKLSRYLARPQTWRYVNGAIGVIMVILTIKLLMS